MTHSLISTFSHIKNGISKKKFSVSTPKTKLCAQFLNVLWDEGYILGYSLSQKNPKNFEIFLKYYKKNSVIKVLKSVSKPSLKIYCTIKELWKFNYNLGNIFISTNKGILTINHCKKFNIGGEILCIIY
jgi:small subunit ribosomal protein S8